MPDASLKQTVQKKNIMLVNEKKVAFIMNCKPQLLSNRIRMHVFSNILNKNTK
jgi:Fe-S cluster biosynthesis and repair protein YggX